jgi:bacterioferritin
LASRGNSASIDPAPFVRGECFTGTRAWRDGVRRLQVRLGCSKVHSKETRAMRGDPQIIDALNEILTSEFVAINQYFIHFRMLENWGYKRLAKKKREESIEEMKHADRVIARILYLEGIPNMQRLGPVRVGEEPIEMHKVDLELEIEARQRLNQTIALCLDKRDAGTRELLESILDEEEDSIDWLEAQLHLVQEIGRERYLAEQIHD